MALLISEAAERARNFVNGNGEAFSDDELFSMGFDCALNLGVLPEYMERLNRNGGGYSNANISDAKRNRAADPFMKGAA